VPGPFVNAALFRTVSSSAGRRTRKREPRPRHAEAVHHGKHDIEDDGVKTAGQRRFQPLAPVVGYHHRMAFLGQTLAKQRGQPLLVFYY